MSFFFLSFVFFVLIVQHALQLTDRQESYGLLSSQVVLERLPHGVQQDANRATCGHKSFSSSQMSWNAEIIKSYSIYHTLYSTSYFLIKMFIQTLFEMQFLLLLSLSLPIIAPFQLPLLLFTGSSGVPKNSISPISQPYITICSDSTNSFTLHHFAFLSDK